MGIPCEQEEEFYTKSFELHFLNEGNERVGAKVNVALVAKLGWMFYASPGRLWVRILKHKYKLQSPLNLSNFSGNTSRIWRGILQAAPYLQVGPCLPTSRHDKRIGGFGPWNPRELTLLSL